MDETVLYPSPNWFLVSNLAISSDGWIIYGGPSKSVCVLEPEASENVIIVAKRGYQAHVVNRAHCEKVVSVAISPEWPDKRSFLTGSADGSVKHWTIEKINNSFKIRNTLSHEIHHHEKEEIAGVGYSTETIAVTVGGYGNIVKWDISSNVAKSYSNLVKGFKPTCMECSPHVPLNVALGTKQGVIFVLDLSGSGKVLYKVRGQDDEVMNVSWCPQYDLSVFKTLTESEQRSFLANRLESIRKESQVENVLEQSGIIKKLPEDSFDESIVQEDDMFDIYKDHEADEFGHKKYQPEDILVKIKPEKKEDTDYLTECLKLKEDILKRKNQEEPSIESLVQAMDKTRVESPSSEPGSSQSGVQSPQCEVASESQDTTEAGKTPVESSAHTHKHLLATIGKFGGVRIWSKSGKLVASCAVPNAAKSPRVKVSSWPTLLWFKPDVLLLVDGKSQLLECNPLQIDCKNKLEWKLVHNLHKRGLYGISSNAPRKLTDGLEHNTIWTVSQDRNIIEYCMKSRKKIAVYATCGGFLYDVKCCPYDAGKVAVSVGDGAVRVWDTTTLSEDDTKLSPGHVTSYWQNVQGKVLTIAWHPTKENLLAFGTAEARVGIIDSSGKSEKPARVLLPALSGGVYSLCWGEDSQLYASGGGTVVVYKSKAPEQAPSPVEVSLEGQRWSVCACAWTARGLLCGSLAGGVALLTHTTPYTLQAATFVFTKMIHTIEWHPQQTSTSNEESPYKNLIAVSSLDKDSNIVILECQENKDGTKQLNTWKTLSGHKLPVLNVSWNPHHDQLLLSTAQDSTVRVWDISTGACVSIFGNHTQCSLGAAWSNFPQLGNTILSGGGDCSLRLWDYRQHKPEDYDETKHESSKKRAKKSAEVKDRKAKDKEDTDKEIQAESRDNVASNNDVKGKTPRKFIMPITYRQINSCRIAPLRKMLQKYLEKNTTSVDKENATPNTNGGTEDTMPSVASKENNAKENEYDMDYIKLFGTTNEVNELLDLEMQYHVESHHWEGWAMLAMFRGHISALVQRAADLNALCPYLLSLAPCVSLKYWKDATQLYMAQIDRLAAKGDEEKLYSVKTYGGVIYRKAAALLSLHDVRGAVDVLTEGRLYKEAYMLCRIRYMDSIAEQTLRRWAAECHLVGAWTTAAACYLALGDLSRAATVLGKSSAQECLALAADIAKVIGHNTFAQHVEKKALTKTQDSPDKTEELIEELPSRIDLVMKVQNGATEE